MQNWQRKKNFHLQLHVAVLEVILPYPEPQPQYRLLQALTSSFQSFELFDVFGAGVLAIDEPCQFNCRLGPARCAVNIDSVVDLVTSFSASYPGISLGQH